MIIDRLEIYHVAMPLLYPWRTAYGEDHAVESVLVRMSSGDQHGWGEATPFAAPCYSPEFASGVFLMISQWLGPALLGQDLPTSDALQQRLSMFKGNPFAKSALDNAWWALESQRVSQPLHTLLGAQRDVVEVGADFGVMDSIDDLLVAVGKAVDQKFARIKLKFRPGWDLEMVRAVRKQHPDHPIHIDCNSGYTLDDLQLFKQLDPLGLAMIEQPLRYDDLVDHATLQRNIETPVCLDESLTSLERAQQAIELESARYFNIKPGRVGGLTVARQIHDLCQTHDVPCWVGGMLESSVGAHQCAALAMLPNFRYPPDLFPSSRFYERDLGIPSLDLITSPDGRPAVGVPLTLGNAATPDNERLQQLTIEQGKLE